MVVAGKTSGETGPGSRPDVGSERSRGGLGLRNWHYDSGLVAG